MAELAQLDGDRSFYVEESNNRSEAVKTETTEAQTLNVETTTRDTDAGATAANGDGDGVVAVVDTIEMRMESKVVRRFVDGDKEMRKLKMEMMDAKGEMKETKRRLREMLWMVV